MLYSSVGVKRIFCFPLVLTIKAKTGFFICNFDANNWLTLFCIEKTSKGWSFWSIIKTKLLSCNCFFLLLVKIKGGEDVKDIGAEDNSNKEGKKEEKKRLCFSFFV